MILGRSLKVAEDSTLGLYENDPDEKRVTLVIAEDYGESKELMALEPIGLKTDATRSTPFEAELMTSDSRKDYLRHQKGD